MLEVQPASKTYFSYKSSMTDNGQRIKTNEENNISSSKSSKEQ
jgi:hypothetical protein